MYSKSNIIQKVMSKMLVGTAVVLGFVFAHTFSAEAKENEAILGKLSETQNLSDSYRVTKNVPGGLLYEQVVASVKEGGETKIAGLTFKQKNLSTLSAYLVEGKLKNIAVSIPSSFVLGEENVLFDPSDGLSGAEHGSLSFEYTSGDNEGITVNNKGEFMQDGAVLNPALIRGYGNKLIEFKRGIARGMKGYHVTALTADDGESGDRYSMMYVWDPEDDGVLIAYYDWGESMTASKVIWDTFVKSVFSTAKSKKIKNERLSNVLESDPYENDLYSFYLPKNWTICECETPYELHAYDTVTHSVSGTAFTSNISIVGESSGETEKDLKTYLNLTNEDMAEFIPGWAFKESKKINVSGIPAVLSEASFRSDDGVLVTNYQLILIKDGVTYIVTAIAPKKLWKNYQKALKASLLTFKVK